MAVDDDLAADAAAHIREGKFLHLLKPIRDLADNWNVDIANELEEYLTHLDRTGFSFDDGPSLDFAEAALLIQSSACVYSKKVEYLHTLVYQALEAVRTKRRKDDAALHGTHDGDVHAGDDDQGVAGPTHRAKAGRRHGMAAEEDDSIEGFLASGWDLADSKDIDLEDDPDAVPPSYSRPPAALLAMEEQLDGQQGDGDSGMYRVARCHVHISGALMLDAMDAHLYDYLLRPTRRALTAPAAAAAGFGQPGVAGLDGHVTGAAPAADALVQGQGQGAVGQAQKGEDDDDDEAGGMPAGFGDDDSDTDGDAPMQEAAAATAAVVGETQITAAVPTAATATGAASGQLPGTEQLQQTGVQGPDQVAVAAQQAAKGTRGRVLPVPGQQLGEDDGLEAEPEPFDPYKPLDPQDPGDLPIKPMQVRKPGKLKKSALFARKTRVGWDGVLGFTAPSIVPGLAHQEFAYAAELLLPAHRHKGALVAAQRGAGQHRKAAGQAGAAAGAADMEAWAAAPAVGEAGLEDGGEDGAGGWPEAAGLGDDDDGDDGNAGGEPGGDGWDDVGAADVLEGMRGHDAQQRLLALGGSADGADGGPSYEDLCKAHIDSMLAAASARQVVTELAQRVGDWRSRIDPLLKAEESRASFDLQSYGEKILVKLVKHKTTTTSAGAKAVLSFQQLASAPSRHDVSRTFAAMLQLINNRNVALQQEGGPDMPFTLQLLTEVQPHKQMADKMRKAKHQPHGAGAAGSASQGEEGAEDVVPGTQEDGMDMGEENVDANIQGSQADSGLEGGPVKGKVAGGKQGAARAPRAKKARGQ